MEHTFKIIQEEEQNGCWWCYDHAQTMMTSLYKGVLAQRKEADGEHEKQGEGGGRGRADQR